jgi:hypothetical protein
VINNNNEQQQVTSSRKWQTLAKSGENKGRGTLSMMKTSEK